MFPFCCRPTYVAASNINIQCVAMETHQCIFFHIIMLKHFIMSILARLSYSAIPFHLKNLMAKCCCYQQQQTSLGLRMKCQIFCLILNKLRFSLHIFLSFPISNFIKIHPVGDEVICADTQGEVSWAGNDLQHEVLGITYTVCR